MQKTQTIFIFIASLVTAILCTASVIFFLHVIKNKNEHSSDALITLAQKITQKDDSSISKKKVAEVIALHDSIASHVVDISTINTFVDHLDAFSASTNTVLAVHDIKLAPKDKNSVLASITITGAFSDVEKAIGLLENDQYQIYITSLSLIKDQPVQTITPQPTVPQAATWHADISFSVLSS